MQHKIIHLHQTASTNDYLRALPSPQDDSMTVVYADWQTAGRGQGSNKWESEAGKNLLFSILVCPTSIDITRQFVLSMAGALAVKAALDKYTDGISLKWPNDIYWHDRKISGTLIETSVKGRTLARCIYGTGINVNQREFHSDAPNPVSLYNIIGVETPAVQLLDEIVQHFDHYYSLAVSGSADSVVSQYHAALYRREGLHLYEDTSTGEQFSARIDHVSVDGRLHLALSDGTRREYTLKEVRFVLN